MWTSINNLKIKSQHVHMETENYKSSMVVSYKIFELLIIDKILISYIQC